MDKPDQDLQGIAGECSATEVHACDTPFLLEVVDIECFDKKQTLVLKVKLQDIKPRKAFGEA